MSGLFFVWGGRSSQCVELRILEGMARCGNIAQDVLSISPAEHPVMALLLTVASSFSSLLQSQAGVTVLISPVFIFLSSVNSYFHLWHSDHFHANRLGICISETFWSHEEWDCNQNQNKIMSHSHLHPAACTKDRLYP